MLISSWTVVFYMRSFADQLVFSCFNGVQGLLICNVRHSRCFCGVFEKNVTLQPRQKEKVSKVNGSSIIGEGIQAVSGKSSELLQMLPFLS